MLICYLFYETQILFWQLFIKAQNAIFGKNNYFMLKAQNYFLAKYILMGKINYSSLKKYFFHKIYGNYAYFSITN